MSFLKFKGRFVCLYFFIFGLVKKYSYIITNMKILHKSLFIVHRSPTLQTQNIDHRHKFTLNITKSETSLSISLLFQLDLVGVCSDLGTNYGGLLTSFGSYNPLIFLTFD